MALEGNVNMWKDRENRKRRILNKKQGMLNDDRVEYFLSGNSLFPDHYSRK